MLKIERDQLAAQLVAIDDLLRSLPDNDYVARMGFEDQRDELADRLRLLARGPEHRAQVALYFGGAPVIGSTGI